MPSSDAESKLQALEKRLKAGWEKAHPIKESHLEAVRDVVREQWAERQQKAAAKKDRTAARRKTKPKSQGKSRSQEHDEGHSQ